MEHETGHLLSRRQVLRGAAGLGLAAATGTVLSECGSDDGDKRSASPPTPTPSPAKPAPQRSINVGDILITYLPDGEGHVAKKVFPNSTDAGWQLHSQWLGDDGRVVTSFGGYLIETGDRKVLVDLGFGARSVEVPDFGRIMEAIDWTEQLAAPGTNDYGDTRALLQARLAPLARPLPEAEPMAPHEREALVKAFLADPAGAVYAHDPDAWFLLDALVDYRCDHHRRDPLRWSPGSIC